MSTVESRNALARTRTLGIAALISGLGLVTGVSSLWSQDREPKETLHRIAFVAGDTVAHPAPHHYEVRIHDLVQDRFFSQWPDTYYWTTGRIDATLGKLPDSNIVFIELEKLKNYEVDIRAWTAADVPSLWSQVSKVFEHTWDSALPDTVRPKWTSSEPAPDSQD